MYTRPSAAQWIKAHTDVSWTSLIGSGTHSHRLEKKTYPPGFLDPNSEGLFRILNLQFRSLNKSLKWPRAGPNSMFKHLNQLFKHWNKVWRYPKGREGLSRLCSNVWTFGSNVWTWSWALDLLPILKRPGPLRSRKGYNQEITWAHMHDWYWVAKEPMWEWHAWFCTALPNLSWAMRSRYLEKRQQMCPAHSLLNLSMSMLIWGTKLIFPPSAS